MWSPVRVRVESKKWNFRHEKSVRFNICLQSSVQDLLNHRNVSHEYETVSLSLLFFFIVITIKLVVVKHGHIFIEVFSIGNLMQEIHIFHGNIQLPWQESFPLLHVELLTIDQKGLKLSVQMPSKTHSVLCMIKKPRLESHLCLSLSETPGYYGAGHRGKGSVLHLVWTAKYLSKQGI